jgi:hypothetical protein
LDPQIAKIGHFATPIVCTHAFKTNFVLKTHQCGLEQKVPARTGITQEKETI